jgi:hypothetical protein
LVPKKRKGEGRGRGGALVEICEILTTVKNEKIFLRAALKIPKF